MRRYYAPMAIGALVGFVLFGIPGAIIGALLVVAWPVLNRIG